MLRENRPTLCTHVLKDLTRVVKEQRRLPVSYAGMQGLDQVVRIPVREEQIKIAIIVIVEKLKPPSAHETSCGGDTRGKRLIIKSFVMVILVDGEHLSIDIGDEEVHPAVLVEIGGIHAHARTRASLGAVSHASLLGDLLEFACATIHKKEIRDSIIGHE